MWIRWLVRRTSEAILSRPSIESGGRWLREPACRLNAAQQVELKALVEAGPDRQRDGVVRWRRVDLQRVIEERFGVV